MLLMCPARISKVDPENEESHTVFIEKAGGEVRESGKGKDS